MTRVKSLVRGLVLGVFCLGCAWLWSGEARAAAFVKYDGIDGEARDKDHKNWIDLLSVSNSPTLGNDSRTSTCPAAPSGPGEIVVVKELDASTPKLQEALCNGTLTASVEIHVHQARRSSEPYLSYKLKDVIVTSYSTSTATDKKGKTIPVEEVTLQYSEIEWNYLPQRE